MKLKPVATIPLIERGFNASEYRDLITAFLISGEKMSEVELEEKKLSCLVAGLYGMSRRMQVNHKLWICQRRGKVYLVNLELMKMTRPKSTLTNLTHRDRAVKNVKRKKFGDMISNENRI